MKEIFLDTKCIGDMILFDVRPNYYTEEGERIDTPIGFKYGVVIPQQGYEKLYVKIPGPQLLEMPLSANEPTVEFTDLRVKPYVDGKTGRMAFSASASGIKVVDATGAGKTQAKG